MFLMFLQNLLLQRAHVFTENVTFLDKSARTGPLTPAPRPLSDKLLS